VQDLSDRKSCEVFCCLLGDQRGGVNARTKFSGLFDLRSPPMDMTALQIQPSALQALWEIVETTQSNLLLTLSDAELVQTLMHALICHQALSTQDVDHLRGYLSDRTPLIRDLASSRLGLVMLT
jgi:hypothetical protein